MVPPIDSLGQKRGLFNKGVYSSGVDIFDLKNLGPLAISPRVHFHLEGFYPVGYPPGFCREISNWYYPWHYPIGYPIVLIGIRYWYYIIIIQLEISFTGSTMRRISPWVLQRILSNRLKRHTIFWSVDRDHSSARASDDDLAVQKKRFLMGKWEGQTWKKQWTLPFTREHDDELLVKPTKTRGVKQEHGA